MNLTDFEKALEKLSPEFHFERGAGLREEEIGALEAVIRRPIPKAYRAFLAEIGSLRIWTENGDALYFFGRPQKVLGRDMDLAGAFDRCKRIVKKFVEDKDDEERGEFLLPLFRQPPIPFAMTRSWEKVAALNVMGKTLTLGNWQVLVWESSFWELAMDLVTTVCDVAMTDDGGDGEEEELDDDDDDDIYGVDPLEDFVGKAIDEIDTLLREPQDNVSVQIGEGLDEDEIAALESKIGARIPRGYREFLEAFGFVCVSIKDYEGKEQHLTFFGAPFELDGVTQDLPSAIARYRSAVLAHLSTLSSNEQVIALEKLSGKLENAVPFYERTGQKFVEADVVTEEGRVLIFDDHFQDRFNIDDAPPNVQMLWTRILDEVESIRMNAAPAGHIPGASTDGT